MDVGTKSQVAAKIITPSGIIVEENSAGNQLDISSVIDTTAIQNGSNILAILQRAFEFAQNLTAQTTTSTTPVSISSLSITPAVSGNILINVIVRGSNNTLGDGITVGLYNGTTLIYAETYTQEGLASNEHTFVLAAYLTSQTIGTALSLSIQINAVTGGTASAKIVEFMGAEI